MEKAAISQGQSLYINDKKRGLNKIETAITVIFTLLYGGLLIYFADSIKIAVKDSVNLCLTVIIPSLYAFMVLPPFLISTGIYRVLSRPFYVFSRYIFRIPEDFFSIFILSSIAGYPVGAKLLETAVKDGKIDSDTAADMQNYCYMGGPAYFCGVVGITLFGRVSVGLIIFLIIFITNILSGIITARKRVIPSKIHEKIRLDVTARKFLSAVTDGGKSTLIMCGIIVFFSTFNCLLEKLGFFTILSKFAVNIFGISRSDGETALRSLIEITNVVHFIPGNIQILPLLTALLSFGGLCVIMQIIQFSGDFIHTGRFFVHRLFGAGTSFLLAKIALALFPSLTAVPADAINGGFTKGTILPSVLLIFMSIILFTFDLRKRS
jgi:hypothetical protein